jgi:L-lysine 6-transaminase
MLLKIALPPEAVHETLRRHMLATGYPIVLDLERSHGPWAKDQLRGDEYLDFSSFYASNPIGFNHPAMLEPEMQARLARAATVKVGNPDFYTVFLAEFVDTLSKTAAPPDLPHYFFVEGGALAVENALKTAFDWKVRKNLAAGKGERGSRVLHFEHAFHGRAGYTLSVTNTDPVKTLHFPKFDWPRLPAPALRFPLDEQNRALALEAEARSLEGARQAFDAHPDDIAAILIEPIQGEGGDNHFRPEFLRALRALADEREALLIFDEVQTGVGLTGKWWAFQHFGVEPDIVCFAKKMQVGGLFASRRIDEVDSVFKVPSRISSTWGGSLADMVRATRILGLIEEENLLENARLRGLELLSELQALAARYPDVLDNPRGLGLMCAVDFSSPELRTRVIKRCFEERLLVLPSGPRSLRFRPFLNVTSEALGEALRRLRRALSDVAA